jgi:tetratricopeptide (TPR) repeat protein
MKNISRWIGVGLCLLIAQAALPALAEVEWAKTSYEDIIKAAKSKDKHVFIDFYATWCGPCKELDKTTFQDEMVTTFLNAMIPVKYDAEKGAGETLAEEYRVSAYPTLILLDSKGKEIDRHIGYLDAADFLRVMNNYVKGIETVADYRSRVKKNPDDANAWKTLGIKHADAARFSEAREALRKFFELVPDAAGEERAELLYTLADVNYRSESYGDAVKIFGQITEEFEDSEWHDRALTMMARTYHKMGNNKKCIDTYMSYVARHPRDPKAMNSFAWFCATRGVGFDKALPIALRAAKLSNRDPGILDTLAELYYAMGNYDKAIEVGREALDKEPEDSYLADQLKKFRQAKEESKKQAKG